MSKVNTSGLKPIIRLAIMSEESKSNSQFGRGVANLCLGVRERGSLNAAAKDMKMAYSKAWKSINATEEHLGFTGEKLGMAAHSVALLLKDI